VSVKSPVSVNILLSADSVEETSKLRQYRKFIGLLVMLHARYSELNRGNANISGFTIALSFWVKHIDLI